MIAIQDKTYFDILIDGYNLTNIAINQFLKQGFNIEFRLFIPFNFMISYKKVFLLRNHFLFF
jgi:hypothetical protein